MGLSRAALASLELAVAARVFYALPGRQVGLAGHPGTISPTASLIPPSVVAGRGFGVALVAPAAPAVWWIGAYGGTGGESYRNFFDFIQD